MLVGEWRVLGEYCASLLLVVTGDDDQVEWKNRKAEIKQFLEDS